MTRAAAVLPRVSRAIDLTVEIVDTPEAFARMQGSWTALVGRSGTPSPFLTWEWLHAWWTHFGAGNALSLVAVRNGEALVGLAPLRSTRVASLPMLPCLEWLGTGHAGSDDLDVLVDPASRDAVLDAMAEAIDAVAVPLRLPHAPSPAVADGLMQRLVQRGWTARVRADGTCPHVRLTGHTWDSWLATLGRSHRANVRRRIRALADRHPQFTRVASDVERQAALAALTRFHATRFRPEGGSTAVGTAALRAFHDDATRRLLATETLWLYTLSLDGRIAAVLYGFVVGSRVYFYQHGFDATFERDSLGLVLMALSIRAAIDEGADDFDMLYGTESYKRLWARDARRLRRLELYPPHLRGTLQHAAAGIVEMARGYARSVRRGLQP